MIVELRVRDLVTIADVTLQLGAGFNVLTGETGAGKSMLVDALTLLLGGRADSGAVRPGAARAIVEGVFEPPPKGFRALLESLGLDADDDRVVIRREVSTEGRSRAWVNGSPTTMAALDQLGRSLADLHGQHQTVSLLHAEVQRGPPRSLTPVAARQAEAVRQTFETLAALVREEQARWPSGGTRSGAGPTISGTWPGDRRRPAGGRRGRAGRPGARPARITPGSCRAQGERIGAAAGRRRGRRARGPGEAERALRRLERLDPAAVAEWRSLLDAAYAALEELGRQARQYAEHIEEEPGRLAEVESRRDLLDRLEQKYGETVDAVLETRRETGRELDLLDTADLDLETLAARRAAAERALATAAADLTTYRRAGAEKLARAVNRLLPSSASPGAGSTSPSRRFRPSARPARKRSSSWSGSTWGSIPARWPRPRPAANSPG